jgi:hypothetical protein
MNLSQSSPIRPGLGIGGLLVAFLLISLSPTESLAAQADTINLTDFGAVGDGITDDGPALQSALDALAAAGGGTLFVPAGHYAIATPVAKAFVGNATSITIFGVESSTAVNNNGDGNQLSTGLDLVSEFLPQTGSTQIAVSISGLKSLFIHDIAFVGRANVNEDAVVTLLVDRVEGASIKHCEFYGLSSLSGGGAIIKSIRSNLSLEKSKFLGSTGNSGLYVPVVEALQWKGLEVTNCAFVDFGQRPDFYGKLGISTPLSWINIGNAEQVTNDSPRREVTISDVFLDEGGFMGISLLPERYQPSSAPIDLVYISGLRMNVSNLGSWGNYLRSLQAVLVENSSYGWSHNADAAISLVTVRRAILDQLDCLDGANHIRADATTDRLSVINSIYGALDSEAQTTDVINTETPEDDPVQYVRQQYEAVLGREPDAAGHYYWSDAILNCGSDANCLANRKDLLQTYLNSSPTPNFAISGQVVDDQGAPLSGVAVTLSGTQVVTTQTDASGHYNFSNLPTSGVYAISPLFTYYSFDLSSVIITTPSGDRTTDFVGTLNRYAISGHVTRIDGSGIAGVNVTLSGSQSAETTSDAEGNYSFNGLPAGGDYYLTLSRINYSISPESVSIEQLNTNQKAHFVGTVARYQISGRITKNGLPLPNTTVTLSGGQSAPTTSDGNGGYSFSVPAEQTYTITPSRPNYSFTPSSVVVSNLSASLVGDFTAQLNWGVPVLISDANSTRAIALDSVLSTTEPFRLTYQLPWSADNRTRITIYATNFDLLPNENATAISGDAQDASGRIYNLTVEYVNKAEGLSWLNCIIVRLSDDLGDVGDVLLRISYHGVASNRVRVGVGHMGGGPPDDQDSVPTPGVPP